MASLERLYPYLLQPFEKTAIWGGDALAKRYGKVADLSGRIGESWECWDANRIANGSLNGETLGGLRETLGADLLGPLDRTSIFPVLTKIIDARLALSVQVHPDDSYAQRIEHQANGKTECWYILSAQPGAELVLGWTRDTDRDEYERRVTDGSLGEILRRVPVAAGETYYLPAGTLHAIGAGIELFEAQQASDLTYRIFDWNRLDTNGKLRELHVAKAADVVDFGASTRTAVGTISFERDSLKRTLLVADRHFAFEHVSARDADGTIETGGLPLTITALGNPLDVEVGATVVRILAYSTVVIPAAAKSIAFRTAGEMLLVRPWPRIDSLRSDALRGGLRTETVDAFFSQFQ